MTGKRRAALNEALHELRRPLQALALSLAPGLAAPGSAESSLRLVAAALDRLEDEINGRGTTRAPSPVSVHSLLEATVARWRPRSQLGGGSLRLRWDAGAVVLAGDAVALSQALDNLIVNAIEHGGPSILVAARVDRGRVRITVADSGREARGGNPGRGPGVLGRLAGRGGRGHGLRVVRRVAAAHGGRFDLRRSERGSTATLVLPIAGPAPAR
jgi:signal transduction histidine kinase